MNSEYLSVYIRYDWPIHFFQLITNWLPDNVFFLRFRGKLLSPFFGSCGKNLLVARNVVFHNPKEIYFGNDDYVGFGSCFLAATQIQVEDEVLIGPYCVIASGNHTHRNGSFRFSESDIKPILIGRGSWLASHVVVTPGSSVGEGCGVSAGSVVTGAIEPNLLIGGVPARKLREL